MGNKKNDERIRKQFKKFLLLKYIQKNIPKDIVCDPTEKLTNFYCVHGKSTSELSLFLERLLKIELTDEYLLNELKDRLEEKNITNELLDVDLADENLKMLDMSDDMLIVLRNKLKNNLLDPYIYSVLEQKISNKMNVSQSQKSILEVTSSYFAKLKKKSKHYRHQKKKYPRRKIHKTDKDTLENCYPNYTLKDSLTDSTSLSSDMAAYNRLDKLHYYPTALDQFGNRVENYKLPGESVNRMLGRLSKALTKQNFSKECVISPDNSRKIMESKMINKFKKLHTSDFVKGGDLLRKCEKQDSYEPRPVSVLRINTSFLNLIKTLTDKKNQLKEEMSKEDFLISEVQKLEVDHRGWTKMMLLSLKLMREGNQHYYNDLSKQIEDRILKEYEKQERAKIKYWSLLNDDQEKGEYDKNTKRQIESDKTKDKYKTKELTFKTINEFMLSRNYRKADNSCGSEEEADGEGSEVSYKSFKCHVLETLKSVFPPDESAEFMSFFGPQDSDWISRATKTGEDVDVFPLSPHINKKQSYISRLSQVRGLVIKENELMKKPEENPYPFGSRTSRGLSPIKKIKSVNYMKDKKTFIDDEDRMKFLFLLPKSQQKKRLCEQQVRQIYYNWEPKKKLGQPVLPGTDILIEAPQIKEIRDIEDSWKYNIPPFDYMKCGLPQDSLEAVANEILQKELLNQEIIDIKREELERKKEKYRASLERRAVEYSNQKSNPAPWQYNVKRWPIAAPPRVKASLSMMPSFVSRLFNRYQYHLRDRKEPHCKAVLKQSKTNISSQVKKKNFADLDLKNEIKLWRNLSYQGLKMKNT